MGSKNENIDLIENEDLDDDMIEEDTVLDKIIFFVCLVALAYLLAIIGQFIK